MLNVIFVFFFEKCPKKLRLTEFYAYINLSIWGKVNF